MQIAAFQRKRKRPLLTTLDRLFWVSLRSVWPDWRHALLYVQPDTVVRWQRERFRKFWATLSKRQPRRGRPGTAAELRRLVEQMAVANPLWRAPRIHGELKMLGIAISERTVSRILRRLRRPPNQTWRTAGPLPYEANHVFAGEPAIHPQTNKPGTVKLRDKYALWAQNEREEKNCQA